VKETSEEMSKHVSLARLLAELDWIEILNYAINRGIFSSAWNKPAVREWRNAGDSIYNSILLHLRDKGIDPYKTTVKVNSR